MPAPSKWMITLSADPGVGTSRLGDIAVWVHGLLNHIPALRGLEFELASPEDHRAHILAGVTVTPDVPVLPPWPGIVSVWTDTPNEPRLPPLVNHDIACVRVSEHRAFDDLGVLSQTGATKGFKKTTFWKSVPGVARNTWQDRYRAHVPTVRTCHSAWAYRQNIIEEKPPSCPYDAVSENWWATRRDLCERFYLSDEAKRAVADEVVTFLDRAVVATVVTRHSVLKPLTN